MCYTFNHPQGGKGIQWTYSSVYVTLDKFWPFSKYQVWFLQSFNHWAHDVLCSAFSNYHYFMQTLPHIETNHLLRALIAARWTTELICYSWLSQCPYCWAFGFLQFSSIISGFAINIFIKLGFAFWLISMGYTLICEITRSKGKWRAIVPEVSISLSTIQ